MIVQRADAMIVFLLVRFISVTNVCFSVLSVVCVHEICTHIATPHTQKCLSTRRVSRSR